MGRVSDCLFALCKLSAKVLPSLKISSGGEGVGCLSGNEFSCVLLAFELLRRWHSMDIFSSSSMIVRLTGEIL
jgi:hypothetical protein